MRFIAAMVRHWIIPVSILLINSGNRASVRPVCILAMLASIFSLGHNQHLHHAVHVQSFVAEGRRE